MTIALLHFCPPSSLSIFLLPFCFSPPSLPLFSFSLFLFLVTTRFDHLQSLGKRVSSSSRAEGDVRERMKQLTMERAALRDAWEKRSKQLKQCSELQVCKDTLNQAPMDAFNLGVPLIVSVSSNFDQPVQHATTSVS